MFVITVNEGKIRGIKKKSWFSGVEYYSFLGIPYGQSTAGYARFKVPMLPFCIFANNTHKVTNLILMKFRIQLKWNRGRILWIAQTKNTAVCNFLPEQKQWSVQKIVCIIIFTLHKLVTIIGSLTHIYKCKYIITLVNRSDICKAF